MQNTSLAVMIVALLVAASMILSLASSLSDFPSSEKSVIVDEAEPAVAGESVAALTRERAPVVEPGETKTNYPANYSSQDIASLERRKAGLVDYDQLTDAEQMAVQNVVGLDAILTDAEDSGLKPWLVGVHPRDRWKLDRFVDHLNLHRNDPRDVGVEQRVDDAFRAKGEHHQAHTLVVDKSSTGHEVEVHRWEFLQGRAVAIDFRVSSEECAPGKQVLKIFVLTENHPLMKEGGRGARWLERNRKSHAMAAELYPLIYHEVR